MNDLESERLKAAKAEVRRRIALLSEAKLREFVLDAWTTLFTETEFYEDTQQLVWVYREGGAEIGAADFIDWVVGTFDNVLSINPPGLAYPGDDLDGDPEVAP